MSAPAPPVPVLTQHQREALGRVFADALDWRRPPPPSGCADCMLLPPGTECGDHEADTAVVAAYVALADELGVEVPG